MNFVQNFLGLGAALSIAATAAQVQAFDLGFETHSAPAFAQPHDITLSPDQRYLYVADNGNDRIAVLEPTSLALVGSLRESLIRILGG